ncbi:hypothetical protein PACTADRAFT_33481 [Pachysolen tannophilus NRRL Y-2460]|uniref:Mediator of RNA polymerase II transcription subunit 7 n=1 Tax=Pachysolen tannophilus NRRL Y-2460 TaxID=669874 RepID=A0A1E4TX36_PACTA|nr:hypothetical protein PACTADRAFT_33481 [Pachysolen tannophilus NRRL Y-2460]
MEEVSALYPAPPPYYKLFTRENLDKLNVIKASIELENPNKSKDELKNLLNDHPEVKSSSLKFLIPPSVPDRETYHSFGNVWHFQDKFMKLEDAGIQQLYPPPAVVDNGEQDDDNEEIFTQERINELKKFTKSLLLNFLELVGLLRKNPNYVNLKIEQIRLILINLHHLLNSYRLHQSREILIFKIENKINENMKDIELINGTVLKIEQNLKELIEKNVDDKIKSLQITKTNIIQNMDILQTEQDSGNKEREAFERLEKLKDDILSTVE